MSDSTAPIQRTATQFLNMCMIISSEMLTLHAGATSNECVQQGDVEGEKTRVDLQVCLQSGSWHRQMLRPALLSSLLSSHPVRALDSFISRTAGSLLCTYTVSNTATDVVVVIGFLYTSAQILDKQVSSCLCASLSPALTKTMCRTV